MNILSVLSATITEHPLIDEDNYWCRDYDHHRYHRRLSREGNKTLSRPPPPTPPMPCPIASTSPHHTSRAFFVGSAGPLLFYIYARSPNSRWSYTFFGANSQCVHRSRPGLSRSGFHDAGGPHPLLHFLYIHETLWNDSSLHHCDVKHREPCNLCMRWSGASAGTLRVRLFWLSRQQQALRSGR